MVTHPHSAFSRRRLLHWGGAAVLTASGLALARGTAAVSLSGVSATVNVTALYVRSGPGTTYSIVGQLGYGARVSCLATAGQWFRISTSTLTGYVYSPYVTLVALASAGTISRGRTDRNLVSLTFDAGADRGYAGSILDTLAAKGVKASFGMTGAWANANSDLIQRMARDGHHLINHTRSHRSFTGLSTGSAAISPAERLDEVETTEASLRALTGIGAKPWFRPPYGDYDAGVLRDIGADGFKHNVMWSLDSLGWNGLTRDQIVSRVLSQHGNGYIYLFHVGAASQDGPALSQIIDGLRNRGYGFGTVPTVVFGTLSPTPTAAPTQTPVPTATPTKTATATPGPMEGIFSDDFESGNLSRWSTVSSLVVQRQEVAAGAYAARGTSSGTPTFARTTLSSTPGDVYYRIRFKVISQGANWVYLLKFRTAADASILGVYVSSTGKLSYRNDVVGTDTVSDTTVVKGVWHELQARVRVNGTSSQVQIWYDGALVTGLNKTESLGTAPVGRLQLGESAAANTYDIAFDSVVADTSCIGSCPTTGNPTATPSPTEAPPTPTATQTPTSTATSTPQPTSTPTNTPEVVPTSSPSPVDTPTATNTPNPTATSTPEPVATFALSPAGGQTGDVILAEGSGFAPDETVLLTWEGSRVAEVVADPGGGFALEVEVPDVPVSKTGANTVTATGVVSGRSSSARFRVSRK